MSFNDTPVDFDHMKDHVTYGELREIAQEAIEAAGKDPQGSDLLMSFLAGNGPLVVGMIDTLARSLADVLDRLENAQEVAA